MKKPNLVIIQKGDGVLIIQEAAYIEDGYFIVVSGADIIIYEIPPFGGEPIKISKHNTLTSAIESYNYLT